MHKFRYIGQILQYFDFNFNIQFTSIINLLDNYIITTIKMFGTMHPPFIVIILKLAGLPVEHTHTGVFPSFICYGCQLKPNKTGNRLSQFLSFFKLFLLPRCTFSCIKDNAVRVSFKSGKGEYYISACLYHFRIPKKFQKKNQITMQNEQPYTLIFKKYPPRSKKWSKKSNLIKEKKKYFCIWGVSWTKY